MFGIAFDLGGPEFVGLDQDRIRDAADRKCRGVEKRLAGNQLFRRFHVRHDVFGRLLRAGRQARRAPATRP